MSRLPRPIIPPPLPASYEQQSTPVIVLNNPPPRPERPWNAHSVLAYVKAAVLLFFLAVTAYGFWSAWRFVAGVSESMAESTREIKENEKTARRLAAARLKRDGLVSIDKNAEFGFAGSQFSLSGLAADEAGKLHRFTIIWAVADFGHEKRWEVQGVSVDGEQRFFIGN